MSLFTTTTATYNLTKYSRAYNHTPNAQPDQGELQWQHFVNPIIRLIMDIRKSHDGHLESYRLKIVWTFSAGLDSMDVDQREVVFEDLDLVAYSSLPSLQTPQGMPLKAVYQEGVVGVRYQHPRVAPPGTTPQYRRFQVVFDTANSATAFIESIRFICPCKANAPPPPRVAQRAFLSRTGQAGSQSTQTSVMAAPLPARPAAQPLLKQPVSIVPEDDSSSAIRRTGTTLPSFATLSNAASNWEVPSAPYGTQASQARSVSVSPAYSSSSSAVSARDDHAYGSSRPSSVVAHHSSSTSSGPSSTVSAPVATANAPAPARVQVPTAVSSTISVPVLAPTLARSTPTARPPQIQPSATILAHSGSGDSLPGSSFPHSSSSPPPMARLRPSSPDLMPPPPVPAIVSRISTPSPAATQTAAPAPPAPALVAAAATPSAAPHTPPAEPVGADTASGSAPAADIVASLRDSAGLYALPKAELEKLVAEVIREEGFADLMKALDGMWRVKGLVGTA